MSFTDDAKQSNASSAVIPRPRGAVSSGLEMFPGELFFGALVVGEDQIIRTFTGTNNGSRTLRIESMTIQQDGDQFLLLGSPPELLRPGETFEIGVKYQSNQLGLATAVVSIQTSEDRTYFVRLSGRVIGSLHIEQMWEGFRALVEEEAYARADADSAEAGMRTLLQATLENSFSSQILEERDARVTALSAEAEIRSNMSVSLNDLITATNELERDARIAGDAAEASSRETLEAELLLQMDSKDEALGLSLSTLVQNAQVAAELAQTSAELAAELASTYRDESIAQATAAEGFATLANTAKSEAESWSNLAAGFSEDAAADAVTAGNYATAADSSKVAANNAKVSAESAATLSATYRDQAQGYAGNASSSATAANTSKVDASAAKVAAESARDLAVGYKNDAQTAATNSQTSKVGADNAKAAAESASALSATYRDQSQGYRDATQAIQDVSWPNYVGPVGGLSYEYVGGNGNTFIFNYGPDPSWPQPYITHQNANTGHQYSRITFKKAKPKSAGRRYRITAWVYVPSAGTNIDLAQLWILGTNTDAWDGSAYGAPNAGVPAGCVNAVNPTRDTFVKIGIEFNSDDNPRANWKPVLELRTTGAAPNSVYHFTGITVEDITSENAAKSSATAAAGSAANASASEANASSYATLSAQYGTGGANLAPQTDFYYDTTGWGFYTPYPGSYSYGRDIAGDDWRIEGEHNISMRQVNANGGEWAEWFSEFITVEALKYYEVQSRMAGHRCLLELRIEWYNSSGVNFYTSYGPGAFAPGSGGRYLTNHTLRYFKDQAPSGATKCRIILVKYGTNSGGDSYAWFHRPQLREVPSTFTGPAVYGPSNNTASVAERAGALATAQGKLSAYWQVDAVAGGRAQLKVYADANGGAGVDIIGDTRISGNLIVDGTIYNSKLPNTVIDQPKLAASGKGQTIIRSPWVGTGTYYSLGSFTTPTIIDSFNIAFSYPVWVMSGFEVGYESIAGSFTASEDANLGINISASGVSTGLSVGKSFANSLPPYGNQAVGMAYLDPGNYLAKLSGYQNNSDGRFFNGWTKFWLLWGPA